EALGGVVETCVNRVGVDLNTASPSLLSYIAGISKAIAKNIVTYREENGPFPSRQALLKVPKLGPKAFEQCAGFLRVPSSEEPLDNTAVHPESYEAARGMLTKMGYSLEELIEKGSLRSGMPLVKIQLKGMDREGLAEELGVGVPTLTDIADELAKPGRDPRSEMPKPVLRTDVLSMEDLKIGMVLKGTVRNVIDFGAFVDIGVHQDGLVHISQLSNKFIKHPLDAVKVGDIVDVKVISLDIAKKRIGLSMKNL
ncbi:MAG: helix-hairpin-helix domain-containing protein, partial [Firmicutes bacterium]|nr:helix-hairpin-helix domain-containing protein [Bacillota bacterium]